MLEDYTSRVIRGTQDLFYQEVDGFWVLGLKGGCLYADALRIVADELDRLNKPWQDQIDKDLKLPTDEH